MTKCDLHDPVRKTCSTTFSLRTLGLTTLMMEMSAVSAVSGNK